MLWVALALLRVTRVLGFVPMPPALGMPRTLFRAGGASTEGFPLLSAVQTARGGARRLAGE